MNFYSKNTLLTFITGQSGIRTGPDSPESQDPPQMTFRHPVPIILSADQGTPGAAVSAGH